MGGWAVTLLVIGLFIWLHSAGGCTELEDGSGLASMAGGLCQVLSAGSLSSSGALACSSTVDRFLYVAGLEQQSSEQKADAAMFSEAY